MLLCDPLIAGWRWRPFCWGLNTQVKSQDGITNYWPPPAEGGRKRELKNTPCLASSPCSSRGSRRRWTGCFRPPQPSACARGPWRDQQNRRLRFLRPRPRRCSAAAGGSGSGCLRRWINFGRSWIATELRERTRTEVVQLSTN